VIKDFIIQQLEKILDIILPEILIGLGMAGTIMVQFFPATHRGFNIALALTSILMSGIGFWGKGRG
jgi:hypothetical protein